MIQLIGHNEIVVNLSKTLKDNNIPFKVYSDREMNPINEDFIKIDTLDELEHKLINAESNSLRLSAGAPWIFNKKFINRFEPSGIFNIHGTPLPLDRGGTIVSWLILNKKRIGNAVIHKIVQEPDAGPILIYKEFIYPIHCHFPKDYIKEYNKQQELIATDLCINWSKGKIDTSKLADQAHYLSTYWPRLSAKYNAWINWEWEGEDIELFIRAFDEPYDGAQTLWRGKTIFLKKAFYQKDISNHPFQWGLVYRIRQINDVSYMAISVKEGTLYVESCHDDNGINMLDYIKIGDRLYHTDDKLLMAKKRTIKTNKGLGPQQDKA